MQPLLDDLAAEHDDLDALVAPLGPAAWEKPTPAEGWTVLDQVAHLWYFDGTGALAATDPAAFEAGVAATFADVDRPHREARALGGPGLLEAWRNGRRRLLGALAALDPSARLPWYGPPMGARSFATARLMETWAHGQDVVDALGATRPATARLRHIAHLGVRTRGFSYVNRGLVPPDAEVRVELDGPDGTSWTWGDEGAQDRVSGPALDFCLLVTQRRARSEVAVRAEGEAAEGWLAIAQAFAGPPTDGRT